MHRYINYTLIFTLYTIIYILSYIHTTVLYNLRYRPYITPENPALHPVDRDQKPVPPRHLLEPVYTPP